MRIKKSETDIWEYTGNDLFYEVPDSIKRIRIIDKYMIKLTIPESVEYIDEQSFTFSKFVEVNNLSKAPLPACLSALNIYTPLKGKSNLHFADDGFIFYDDERVCYLVGYTGGKLQLILPTSFNQKPYAIFDRAFENTDITDVIIPEGVTEIGAEAFRGCEHLKNVALPSTMRKIRTKAFESCKELTEINIPEGVLSLGIFSFSECKKLKKVSLPSSLFNIESSAFDRCENLTDVYLSEGINMIGYRAFGSCYDLAEITIPRSVTYMGKDVFRGCGSIKRITMPRDLYLYSVRKHLGFQDLNFELNLT